jgi:hypothetical protein
MFGGDIHENTFRWPLAMYEEWPDLRKHTKFQRQFVTLTREHAIIVDQDDFLIDLFKKHCYIGVERRVIRRLYPASVCRVWQ